MKTGGVKGGFSVDEGRDVGEFDGEMNVGGFERSIDPVSVDGRSSCRAEILLGELRDFRT